MMTDSDETWKAVPGYSAYEASTESVWERQDGRLVQVAGGIRSVDRTVGARHLTGQMIRARVSNKGYLLIGMTADDGVRQTLTVQKVILTTFAGPPKPGQQARHLDDNPLNNRWAPWRR